VGDPRGCGGGLNRPEGHLGVRATHGEACARPARRGVGLELEPVRLRRGFGDDTGPPPVSDCGRRRGAERAGGGRGLAAGLLLG
jgi:hypothetical protein